VSQHPKSSEGATIYLGNLKHFNVELQFCKAGIQLSIYCDLKTNQQSVSTCILREERRKREQKGRLDYNGGREVKEQASNSRQRILFQEQLAFKALPD
jgi:hypothetical protein